MGQGKVFPAAYEALRSKPVPHLHLELFTTDPLAKGDGGTRSVISNTAFLALVRAA